MHLCKTISSSTSLLSASSNIQVYHQISRIVLGEGSDVTLDSNIQQFVSAVALCLFTL